MKSLIIHTIITKLTSSEFTSIFIEDTFFWAIGLGTLPKTTLQHQRFIFYSTIKQNMKSNVNRGSTISLTCQLSRVGNGLR